MWIGQAATAAVATADTTGTYANLWMVIIFVAVKIHLPQSIYDVGMALKEWICLSILYMVCAKTFLRLEVIGINATKSG